MINRLQGGHPQLREFINACSAHVLGSTSTEENSKQWLTTLVYTAY